FGTHPRGPGIRVAAKINPNASLCGRRFSATAMVLRAAYVRVLSRMSNHGIATQNVIAVESARPRFAPCRRTSCRSLTLQPRPGALPAPTFLGETVSSARLAQVRWTNEDHCRH